MSAQLDALAEEILSDAQKEASKIIQESEAETGKILADAESLARQEAQEVMHSAKSEAESIRRKLLSEAKHKARLSKLEAQNALVDQVISEAQVRVRKSLTSKDALQGFFVSMLTDALKEFPTNEVVAKIGKETSGRLEMNKVRSEISRAAVGMKIEWQTDNDVEADGVVVESRDGGIRAVNNVTGRFERLDREILVEIRRRLFGE